MLNFINSQSISTFVITFLGSIILNEVEFSFAFFSKTFITPKSCKIVITGFPYLIIPAFSPAIFSKVSPRIPV